MKETCFSDLVGLTIQDIKVDGAESITFVMSDGRVFSMHHNQDCCESVYIEDICGDMSDLIGSPITQAEEASNSDDPPPADGAAESYTWTFYKLATNRGGVTIRWFGTSNGYYSEYVDFSEMRQGGRR